MRARLLPAELGLRGSSPEVAVIAGSTAPAHSLLPGVWVENGLGPVFVARTSYALGHRQGIHALEEFLSVDSRSLAALCREPALEGLDLSSALFLDTETTGLDPRSGALAFLVGVGYFDGDRFQVSQFFLEDVDAERAMLCAVADLLREFQLLVTFNGKSFDAPLLATRLALHAQAHCLHEMPHADLLHPARRLWKERLQSCRLTNLERQILGVGRTGDVPGSVIPELYARYLVDGDARRLLPVFYHNAQDLLTLLALSARAASTYSRPFDGTVQHGLDFLSLGKAYEAAGEMEMALRAYDRALSMPLHPAARAEVCKRVTPLYKRTAQLAHAVALWEEMVSARSTRSTYPYEELAKHHEHVTRQYGRAEALVLEALRLLPGDTCTRTTRRDLEKRLRRIQTKQVAGSSEG
ncbi:MAG: ribonuclease H-like domain-containing protein [Chloroflexota bacterium]|nr:ribonuclease H-like domain-containing protein [Chloroflexota bacterium]